MMSMMKKQTEGDGHGSGEGEGGITKGGDI